MFIDLARRGLLIAYKLEGKQKYVIADKPTIKEIGVALVVYKKLMENNGLNRGQLDLKKMLNEKVTIDKTPMYALFFNSFHSNATLPQVYRQNVAYFQNDKDIGTIR